MAFSSSRSFRKSGVALVMVLVVLVLVTGLVVALLSLAKGERKSASVYRTNEGVRQLADNAVGIVQAQINHATTQASAVAWASQPGMIRTYKTDGSFDTAYKLYSASSLTETNVGIFPNNTTDYPPADWASSPALWSDLNAPVNADGTNVYPIINPVILDSSASDRPQGFDIVAAPGSTTNQRAPMPVRWLYILQDGQIVAPTASGTAVIVSQATQSNPIKGRIAFWTDDDSCKVNINTAGAGASGGGFWDTPRYDTVEERKYATSQPLNGEFQRYPGHPAMTSLSAVFPTLSDQAILSTVTPRYQWGGSTQGTTDTVFTMNDALKSGSLATGPLYADPNELIFQPSTTARVQNSNFSRDVVDKAQFFVTTDSQAPEVNLLNLPRIACWPVHADLATNPASPYTTAFDRLIARCASTGSSGTLKPYYFQRKNALSPTDDASINRNQQLFSYLQYLTSQTIPGFGVDLASKFGADRDQILTEIWDYIRSINLADLRLGAGYKFTADDGDTNGNGYGYVVPLEQGNSSDPNRGFGRSMTVTELAFIFICTADPKDKLSDPTKTASANPKGLLGSNDPAANLTLGGTTLNTNQRRIQMMILPKFFSPSLGDIFMMPKNMRVTISGLNSLTLGGNSLFSNNSRSRSLSDFAFNTGYHHRSLGGPFDYRSFIDGSTNSGKSADHDPGILDTGSPAYPFISNFVTVNVTNPSFDESARPGTMVFATGQLAVTIETSADGSTWHTSQVITIKPPSSTSIPIPNLVRTGARADSATGAPASNPQCWWAFSNNGPWPSGAKGPWGRLALLYAHPGFSYIPSNLVAREQTDSSGSLLRGGSLIRGADNYIYYTDVVRSMALSHGDARLVCALKNVPSNAFSPVGNWGATGPTDALKHTLGTGYYNSEYIPGCSQFRRHFVTTNLAGGDSTGGSGGILAPDFRNDLAANIYNAVGASGDFDTPVAFWTDGAYINKPDEGNVSTNGAGAVPYFQNNEKEKLNFKGYFSPNRIIPGPGMFGSLPTHVKRYEADPQHPELYAWRTLLFRKQPGHPDAVTTGTAPDHLLMDLFWMPAVEPYAISEPFSTAGKVNMNYQIQPFTYIQRPTGMYAVMQREKLAAVTNDATTYAAYKDPDTAANFSLRLNLDAKTTLEQFDTRFSDSSGRLFLSTSELCDLWLVPQGESVGSMPSFWTKHNLTGDNIRERPYTTIIPRLTTRSNTYTVHYRVQSLQQTRAGRNSAADWTKWAEGKDQVTGEYRGSTTIQRFVDMNNTTLQSTDFAVNTGNVPSLNQFYRWRVISTKQFAP